MVNKKVQRIKLIIAIVVVIIVGIIVFLRIDNYNKYGEKNMPYSISKIAIISTARQLGNENEKPIEETTSIWNFDVVQNNDLYIEIKNDRDEKNKIKRVSIENIEITEKPSKGNLKIFMPNSTDGARYTYEDDFEVNTSLTYGGADESSFKDLKINKNGGIISISFANKELGAYSSGEDTEIPYDGRMLSKLGITSEDVKSKVAFDLVIELEDGKTYAGRIDLDLNCEGLVENGTTKQEITDFSNVIFKRR